MSSFKPIQILLVEDNSDDVAITLRALATSKVANDLHVARDGQEALDFIFQTGEFDDAPPRADLVLLDINLPKVTGIEVLQHIRSNPATALIPVIMLTASSNEEDVVKSYRLRANTYIQKPVEFDGFLHALDVIGQYWVTIATPPPASIAA
jgi:two-component system, response regulator